MISYSGWNLFGGVAAISKSQGISIILNIFFGTAVNAAQGVANQVSAAINMFVSNFQIASNPQIIKSYASGDKEYMNSLVIRTAKFSFYLLFILTLPVMLEIEFILKLWLKIVPEYTPILTILILINVLIDTISGPLMTSLHATGRIKTYQAVVGVLLILILPVSYLLFKLGYAPYTTFIVSIIASIIAFSFRLLLTKKQIPEFMVRSFLIEIVIRNFPVILFSVMIPLLLHFNMQTGFIRLLVVSCVSICSSISAVYFIGLKNNEKMFVKNTIAVYTSKMKK